MHVSTRSVNSMAGFPEAGSYTESGHQAQLPSPGSLTAFVIFTEGPGPLKIAANELVLPKEQKT